MAIFFYLYAAEVAAAFEVDGLGAVGGLGAAVVYEYNSTPKI